MPSMTKDQQAYYKLVQFFHCTSDDVDDVNVKILSNKSSGYHLEGSTPLHIACFNKRIKVFDDLLKRGANITTKNNEGHTALHKAFYRVSSQRDLEKNSLMIDHKFVKLGLDVHVKFGICQNPSSTDGLSHFHIACAANHLQSMQLFLDAGVQVDESVNTKSSIFAGYTSLHFAVSFGRYEAVKFLLEHGANIFAKDVNSLSPLHMLIEKNVKLVELKKRKTGNDLDALNKYMKLNEKIISLFLENNELSDGDSAYVLKFHAACTLSDSSLAAHFLQKFDVNKPINADAPMWPGYTALHFAANFNIDTVKLLLKNGADIGAEGANGISSLDLCMQKYNLDELHKILLAVPAIEHVFFSDNKTRLSDFVYAISSLTTLDSFFKTVPKTMALPQNSPLWPGCYSSHLLVHFSEISGVHTEQLFLSLGDAMKMQDGQGRTPLHLAFYKRKANIFDLFFRHQLVVEDIIDSHGLSYLHIACDRPSSRVVENLLSQGADVNGIYKGRKINFRVNSGSTPLHVAVPTSNIKIMEKLIEYGADANAIDVDGKTPMHQLIHLIQHGSGSYNTVQLHHQAMYHIRRIGALLFFSCKLMNVVANNGLSHLHIASLTGTERAVEGLLKLGADMNTIISCNEAHEESFPALKKPCVCFSGYTPLQLAIESEHAKVIELLLNSGADVLHIKTNGKQCAKHPVLLDELLDRNPLKYTHGDRSTSGIYASMITSNAILKKRIEEDTGLTSLHIACFLRDVEGIRSLLADSQVDVNAQMHAHSPLWPKSTPLHLLISSNKMIKNLEDVVKLMLDHGANVLLVNKNGNTPAHEAWSNWCTLYRSKELMALDYNILHLLMKYHKNVSINPVNDEGISHFHLACFVGEYTSVEKYLENGVDVNWPVDYRNKILTFETPLTFMLGTLTGVEARLQTIDVLMKYGANIDIQDETGFTPFLTVASKESPRERFFDKLLKFGADINSVTRNGQSVLEVLLHSRYPITKEELQFFFGYNNHFNEYNSVNGRGIISMIIHKKYNYLQVREAILDQIIEIPSLFVVNRMGRTPIHNVVANHESLVSAAEYAYYIEKFIKMGYDIDAQDSEGRTALHMAVNCCNEKAVSGLLIAGADVKVIDKDHRTVLAILSDNNIHMNAGVIRVINKIVLHEIALFLCGLELNSHDFKIIELKCSEKQFRPYYEEVMKEIEMSKLVTIGKGSLTLYDFLSETGAVASRPSMASEVDRQAIDNFFETIEIQRFPNLNIVLKLQYRKTLERLRLVEPATESLKNLLGSYNGFHMPDICCRLVLRFLTNTEVKNLMMSMPVDKTA